MWALVTLVLTALVLLVNWKRSGRPFGAFVGLGTVRIYARLMHGCTFPAPVKVPPHGPALIVVNHTSSPDGCFVQCGCPRGLTFLVAAEFFKPFLLWIWRTTGCVPVNRNGNDISALRTGLKRLDEGKVVVVFPEGTLSGAGLGITRTPKCGAALMALKKRVPVFPAHISGGPQSPDVASGWFLPSPRRARIVYGEQLDLSPYLDRPITRALLEEVSAFFMKSIAALDPALKK